MLLSAANTSAMLLYIITNAMLFSLLTSEQIPQATSQVDAREASRPLDVPRKCRVVAGRSVDGAQLDYSDSGVLVPADRNQYGHRPYPPGLVLVTYVPQISLWLPTVMDAR